MQRKNNNTFLKIACATSMCIFSLFACFAGAIAWFTGIRVQDPKNTGMNGKNDDIHTEYFLYKFSTSDMKGTNTDEFGNILDIKNFNLNTHDTIFLSKNKYTPALLRIKLYGTSIEESGDLKLTIKRNTSLDDSWEVDETDGLHHKSNEVISSVVGFQCGFDSALYPLLNSTESSSNVDPIGTAIRYAFGTDTRAQVIPSTEATFTSFEVDETAEDPNKKYTFDKIDLVEFTRSYTASDWVSIDDKNCLNLYLLINYSDHLLETVTSRASSLNFNDMSSTDANYVNDLLTITVDHI